MDPNLTNELKAYRDRLIADHQAKTRKDDELHAQLAELKRQIEHVAALIGEPTGEMPIRLHPSFSTGSPLADAAYEVLATTRRPMHYREITRALQDRGVAIGGRDPSNNVIAAMARDDRFYRPSRGTYFLRELAKGPIVHVGVRHSRKGA